MDILVLHPGALGDIILSLPALAILRRTFPQAGITLAGNHDYLTAISPGYAERLLSLSGLPLHNLFGREPVPPADRQFWTSFDRILSWTGFGDAEFCRNLNSSARSVLVVPWRPEAGEARHVSRIFVDSIRPWVGEQREIPAPTISLSPCELTKGETWLTENGWNRSRPIVALHPGAGSVSKRWPLENFRELAIRIMQSGAQLMAVEGPAEHGVSREMALGLPGAPVVAARILPLETLAAALSLCAAFVGNDSGIAHMAGALGVPSVVLFGPTSPEQWAPIGGRVGILRTPAGCRACGKKDGSEHTCMRNLSVDCAWNCFQSFYPARYLP